MNFDTISPWGTWKPKGFVALCLLLIDTLPPSPLFRRLAFILRKPVKSSKQDVYDREVWGLQLRLATRGNLTEQRWLTVPQFHDALERHALRASLQPGSIFLDIGANAGFYTFWALAQKLPGLHVVAVEPTQTMLERLRHNLAANQLTAAVTLLPCAVTAKPCQVAIEEHSENLGQSSLRPDGCGHFVEGKPLADILHEAGVSRVDAMKIDIEGHEVPVLEAFFQTAPRSLWPRLIIGEIVGKNGTPLKQLLVAHGYHLEKCTKMNGILYLIEA